MSKLKLDTRKYDSIGMTDQLLREYLAPIVGEGTYYISNDRINGRLVRRDLNNERIVDLFPGSSKCAHPKMSDHRGATWDSCKVIDSKGNEHEGYLDTSI